LAAIVVGLYGNGLIFNVVVVVGTAIVNAETAFNVSLKTGLFPVLARLCRLG
jgi:hypothetical protein